ncbi:MAG: hypothetical protein AAF494_10195 [Pseudomonadota bacterium]
MATQQTFDQAQSEPEIATAASASERRDMVHVPGIEHIGPTSVSQQSRLFRFVLCLAVFLCGWSIWRVGNVNLTVSDIAISLVVVSMLFRGELNTKPFGSLTVFWLLGLALMLGGLLLSTMVNGEMFRWLIVAAQYLFAFLLLPMVLMGQQISLTRQFPALFVLGITVSQMIGISASLLFDYNDTIGLMGDGFLTGNGRVGAMTGEPNPNGAMVAFALPMLLYCIRKQTITVGIGLLCGFILIWGLLSSGSFTGFASSVVATSVFLIISGLGLFLRFALVGVVGGLLFLAAGAPLPEAFEERVAGALATGDLNEAGTFTDRAGLISEAWQMADDNAVIGLGVDQYRIVSPHGAPVHELHLLIWNEGGAIAFVGLLTILLILVAGGLSALARSREEGAMILAVVAVFMVYTFSIPHMYSRMWIMPVLLAMSTFFAVQPSFNSVFRPWQRS